MSLADRLPPVRPAHPVRAHRVVALLHGVALTGLVLLLAACKPAADGTTTSAHAAKATRATTPSDAVLVLTRHLHDNDLDAFARDAVTPDILARLDPAWRAGDTRWPLDELPLGERLPGGMARLNQPGAGASLQKVFNRQFANAGREIRSTAATLGAFGAQYVRNEGDFSDSERQHYPQVIAAISLWAQQAPLADPARAQAAIPKLVAAGRATGLASEADFARLGMHESLKQLSPLAATTKQLLAGYGLKLDDSLANMDASLQQQTGDTAKVRMRYRLGSTAIDTVVDVERHGQYWYVSDFLRHAEEAAGPVDKATPGGPSTPGVPPSAAPDPSTIPADAATAGAAASA